MKYTHAFFAGFLVLVLLGAGCSNAVVEEVEEVAEEMMEEVMEETDDEEEEMDDVALVDGSFVLNPETSVIDWTAGHILGDDRLGTIEAKDGMLALVDGALTSVNVTIDMTSLEAELGDQLSDHLKNSDFFEVETYPTASFTNVQEFTDVVGEDGMHTLSGEFTIKDITSPQEVSMTVTMEDEDTLRAIGTVVLDRTVWGIEFGSASFFSLEELGDKGIEDEFTLDLNLAFDLQ